jgi:hypothetical protein
MRSADEMSRKRPHDGPRGWLLAAALMLALCPVRVAAQQTETLAPFASRLKADVVEHEVKLTWKDSPDVRGVYLVYRSLKEITPETLGSAQLLGQVQAGVEFYVDVPSDQTPYFYAVLLQDTGGKLYPMLIPFRNKTSNAVAVSVTGSEEELAARVTGIKATATASGDGVQVSFQASNPARDLLLFWGTSPLASALDLLRFGSATQLDAGITRYVLPVLPGVPYWFAVVDAGMYKIGKAPLQAGVNATAAAVEIPVEKGRAALAPLPVSRRALPLPSLAITYGVQSGSALGGSDPLQAPKEVPVSPSTAKAISLLLQAAPAQAIVPMKAQILPADASPLPGGELAQLQAIVAGPFSSGDMAGAQKQLLGFLALPRSAEVEAHARFYLGQSYYVQGDPRDALLEFLTAETHYYQATQPWEDACYQKLESTDN